MVNELRELLRENIASAPAYDVDLTEVLTHGRRRRRRRRGLAVIGGTAVATAAIVAVTSIVGHGTDAGREADRPPSPDAPTLRLADASPAVEGRDYRLLASHTNDDLNHANGQYFDGVTDDGLILFRDEAIGPDITVRLALMEPENGEKDWLPDPPTPAGEQLWPLDLGADRLVLTGLGDLSGGGGAFARADVFALVYDRQARTWDRVEWPALPAVDVPSAAVLGPDGRLYVRVPATKGKPPEGGWPTGPNGEADDAGAEGDAYALWSASLTDPSDVRDEGMLVGDLAFTDEAMVWTDRTNGDSGLVHVRDLASGEEHSFDPHSGDRCNLLSFGATTDRIVMGQYCGTYAGGGRDDRVQILTTDGDQVVTIQDSGIFTFFSNSLEGGLVTFESYEDDRAGTYVFDLDDERFLRVSDSISQWGLGGPTAPGMFLWHTSVNDRKGATQWLGELLPR